MTNADIDAAVMEVVRSLRPRRDPFWRATAVYERMAVRPRSRAEWDGFVELDEVTIRRSLDRLQMAGRIERVHHQGTGRPRKDRVYEYLVGAGEAA